jgi:hypothetical protein
MQIVLPFSLGIELPAELTVFESVVAFLKRQPSEVAFNRALSAVDRAATGSHYVLPSGSG